jgi:hypothetical protein
VAKKEGCVAKTEGCVAKIEEVGEIQSPVLLYCTILQSSQEGVKVIPKMSSKRNQSQQATDCRGPK